MNSRSRVLFLMGTNYFQNFRSIGLATPGHLLTPPLVMYMERVREKNIFYDIIKIWFHRVQNEAIASNTW